MAATLITPPSPDSLASVIWLFGLLIALAIGTLVSVVLLMRMLRHRHQPASPRKSDSNRDPWLESGRRLEADDE